ncbi:MAG: dihydroorotate dehydrogenase electron transfer subunit [Thermoplasmata archaeon]|nr:dihydroorotate dehydrogenase electron transfer subunit [Thermoplasmata archaeon]
MSSAGLREVCTVLDRAQETPSTVTLRFEYPREAHPGQFVMVWLPGDDELPMSLSYTGREKGVTVKAMGETSRRILDTNRGAKIGIRGPYGNRFDLSPRRILVVGGGSGTAVLAPAAEEAHARGAAVTFALGATTAREMLFAERLRPIATALHLATDDGSAGHHGYVTAVADRLLAEAAFDVVWTCGPEVMMRKVLAAGDRASVPVFGSVERQMKCSLGLCDACALGPYHVCIDGPVFPGHVLQGLEEFGRSKRDPSGRLVPV